MSQTTARRYEVEEGRPGCRPFLKWAGGKAQLLPELIRRFPRDYGRYFEPFLGGGALFFAHQPRRAAISDINEELINAYRVVRNSLDRLLAELSVHRYERSYYYDIRGWDRLASFAELPPVRRAARLIFLNRVCFNGLYRVNSRGQFNVPFGEYSNPKIVDEMNLRACSSALRDTEIACESYLTVEERVAEGDFVYFDPPYAPLNPTSNFTSYSANGFGPDDQIALRDLCHRLDKRGVKFLVSNSSAPFILELYRDFRTELVAASRAINSKGTRRGKIHETIISNF